MFQVKRCCFPLKSKCIPVARDPAHKTRCRALPLLVNPSLIEKMDVPYSFWVYKQNRGRLQMAPCVYLNWHVCSGAEMEEAKPPVASPQCACAHVRVSACVCTGHAVTRMFVSAPTCAPLFDVRLSLCLDKWPPASPAACGASDEPFLSLERIQSSRRWRRTVTFLPANVKQHFPPRLLMWCMGSSVSRVIISQRAWQHCLLLLPLLPPHSAPSLSPDNKAQVIGRTVSGTNGLPGCLIQLLWGFIVMIMQWSLDPGTGRSIIHFVMNRLVCTWARCVIYSHLIHSVSCEVLGCWWCMAVLSPYLTLMRLYSALVVFSTTWGPLQVRLKVPWRHYFNVCWYVLATISSETW